MRRMLTHGGDAHQWRRYTGVQAPCKSFLCNGPPYDIHGAAVHALLRCLHPHFDQIKRVPHDDGTNATNTAGGQRTERL
jgi:hypothetical protein